MNILFLLLLSLANFAQAYGLEGAIDCDLANKHQLDTSMERTANFFDDQNDPCKPAPEVELENLKKQYRNNYPGPKTSRSVSGVNLEGSGEEFIFFQDFLGSKPPANWKAKIAECKTVLCAVEKILDNQNSALRVLNISARDGYVVSVSQVGRTPQLWTRSEIARMEKRLAVLPNYMRRLSSLRYIYKGADADSREIVGTRVKVPDGASIAGYSDRSGRQIILFETGLRNSLEKTLVHEVGHHVDNSGIGNMRLPSRSSEFRKLSGWNEKKKANFVNDYAGTDPEEDFAESMAYYMERPAQLKRIDQDKYKYYRDNFFSGQEFIPKTWPELERGIEQFGGHEEAIKQCLESLGGIKKFFGGQFISYVSQSGVESDTFIDHCAPQAAVDIGLYVADFCSNGGPRNIAKILEDKWVEKFSLLNEKIKNAANNAWSLTVVCMENGKSNDLCIGKKVLGDYTSGFKEETARAIEIKVGEIVRGLQK